MWRLGGRLVLALSSVLVGLTVGEVVIRALGRAPEVRPIWVSTQDSVYRRSTNPLLSYELQPGYRNDAADLIRSYESTNSHGQRDLERSLEKPPGTRRVIVMGDSIVEGAGIRGHETMTRQLERLFMDGTTEVLNFGVSGYCTLAEIELLEVKGLAFEPDVVIVVFVENDFLNFNREGFALAAIERPAAVKQLYLRSHLFRLLALRMNLFHFGTEADPAAHNRRATGDNNVAEGLSRLSDLAAEHGFEVLIAIWPGFLDNSIRDAHFVPEDPSRLVVEGLASLYGIPTVRLSDYFRRAWRATGAEVSPRLRYSIGDELHPSAEGNRVAAEALREILADLEAGAFEVAESFEAGREALASAEALGREPAPDYAETLNRLGNGAAESQDLEAAIRYYSMAVAEDPGHADAHNGLGVVRKQQGDISAAASHFREAVEIAPDFFEARYNLAVVLEQQGRMAEAAAEYERVLSLRPDVLQARRRLDAIRR